MKLNWRMLLALAHDLAACAAAWMIAFWLRFNLEIPGIFLGFALQGLLWMMPVNAALFWSFGLYRGLWRFASLPDLRRIVFAVGVGAVAVPTLLYMLQIPVPRSVLILSPILLMMIMGGSRIAYRAWKERTLGLAASGQR